VAHDASASITRRPAVAGRAVLLDVARHLSVACLDADLVVGPELFDEVWHVQGSPATLSTATMVSSCSASQGIVRTDGPA
jgi:hypothetical protein